MKGFLRQAEDMAASRPQDARFAKSLETVLRARRTMQNLAAASSVNLDNVEEILTLFEMMQTLDHHLLPNNTPQELLLAAKHVVARTIEESVKIPCNPQGDVANSNKTIQQSDAYRMLIRNLRIRGRLEECAFITFNYDYALDAALLTEEVEPLYHPDHYDFMNNGRHRVPVIKMHGATHWQTCECGEPLILGHRAFQSDRGYEPKASNSQRPIRLEFAESGSVSPHLAVPHPVSKEPGHRITTEAFIQPPSWYKMPSTAYTRTAWQLAAESIRRARVITMIGYSWPESDKFFQQLFAVGRLDADYADEFHIVDPEADDPKYRRPFAGVLSASIIPVRGKFEEMASAAELHGNSVDQSRLLQENLGPTRRSPNGQ